MDTALLMDTMIHLLASSLLLMFDCDHTFLLILYFYILYPDSVLWVRLGRSQGGTAVWGRLPVCMAA